MGGKLYERKGQIECASRDQTNLVQRIWAIYDGAYSLCSAKISSSETSVSMVTCTK